MPASWLPRDAPLARPAGTAQNRKHLFSSPLSTLKLVGIERRTARHCWMHSCVAPAAMSRLQANLNSSELQRPHIVSRVLDAFTYLTNINCNSCHACGICKLRAGHKGMNRLARRDAHQAAPACVWEFAIVNANGHHGLLEIGNISVEVLHVVLERHPHDGDTR